MTKDEKIEIMLENPTKHQLRVFFDAKEKACRDAMKSSVSKNPHNPGSDLAKLWDFIYDEYYDLQ